MRVPTTSTPKSSRSRSAARREAEALFRPPLGRHGGGLLKPPSTGELERTLRMLVGKLDAHQRKRQRTSGPLEAFTLSQLARASCADLRARDLARDPIGTGLRCAARNIARLLAAQLDTACQFQRVIERIPMSDIERSTTRMVLLDHICDGATTRDGERWIA